MNLLSNLRELVNQQSGGQLFSILYRIGVMPTYLKTLSDDPSIIQDYNSWIDFNNENSLDYLESFVFMYENNGVAGPHSVNLFIQHSEIVNRMANYLLGREVYHPPSEVDAQVTKYAYEIVKSQLEYVYEFKG